MRASRSVPAAVLAVLALGAGCARPDALPPAASGPAAAATSAPAAGPSDQARMLCDGRATGDIELAVGMSPTSLSPLAYADHTTSCRYVYPNGSFAFTVQDLADDLATTKAYEALAARLGRTQDIDLQDAQAFQTPGGSVVLRKDTKVLLIDVTDLPASFGQPPVDRASAARLVMKAVVGCWTG